MTLKETLEYERDLDRHHRKQLLWALRQTPSLETMRENVHYNTFVCLVIIVKTWVCLIAELFFRWQRFDPETKDKWFGYPDIVVAHWGHYTVGTENGTDHRWWELAVGKGVFTNWFVRIRNEGSL